MSARSKAEWVHAYAEQLRTQRKLSPHTLDAYRRDLAELAALSGETAWTALTQADLRRYAARLHGKQLAPRSIARKLSGWRGFFDWLAGQTALAANPVQGVRAPKRAKALPKALSVDDAVRLVSTAPRAHAAGGPDAALAPAELCNQAMFELLYSSGLRVSELVGLDLHYSKDALGWLEQGNADVTVLGKGNKRRTVPVGQAAMAAIAAWLKVRPAPADGSAALFTGARGTRVSARTVQLRLKAHGVATGAPSGVHPHMLRHSFASHVLQSSGDLRAVQDMLGHATIASTQVYTALDFQHLAQVYDQAHPRAKVK
ncbi:recombinase XerC [Massilia sp. Root418]|uniref:tyrosine recombinase XerC n=1 Tax=Massilia sp. Root418 TaxID=1736532 RepID=UPI0006F312B5|nr:tyrosine recombinase XerC [Massilia sp. Root418]KQW90278.1 recombinase XerC [Massilia sp. Root418]